MTFGTMALRHAIERLVAEVPGLAPADDGPVDLRMCEAAQTGHGGDDGRHVGDLFLGDIGPRPGYVMSFLPSPS